MDHAEDFHPLSDTSVRSRRTYVHAPDRIRTHYLVFSVPLLLWQIT